MSEVVCRPDTQPESQAVLKRLHVSVVDTNSPCQPQDHQATKDSRPRSTSLVQITHRVAADFVRAPSGIEPPPSPGRSTGLSILDVLGEHGISSPVSAPLLTGCHTYTLILQNDQKRVVVPRFVPVNAPPASPGGCWLSDGSWKRGFPLAPRKSALAATGFPWRTLGGPRVLIHVWERMSPLAVAPPCRISRPVGQ